MTMSRRTVLASAAVLGLSRPGFAAEPGNAWHFEMPSIDEGTLRFADYRGKVLLVVNTASYCGFTYQYKQLEALHRDMAGKGLAVIGIPSQDFGQEKDSNSEVKAFCELTYGVEFPMAGLSKVRGTGAVPFYQWVKAERNWEPHWNFYKVLIGRDGQIVGTFSSDDEPDRGKLKAAIEAAVARPAA